VSCTRCHLWFVKYYKTEEGLPNGLCGGCANSNAPRVLQYKEFATYAHQVFGESFLNLSAAVGFKVTEPLHSGVALYDAVLKIAEMEPQPSDPPQRVLFREAEVHNKDEIWKYIISVMSGAKPTLPECSICLEQFPPGELVFACGRRGCLQRVCGTCSRSWYAKNKPGTLLYQRAVLCQFCGRVPAPNILARISNHLIALASFISKNPLNPDVYYGWCSQCLKPKEIATRSCTEEAPTLNNYKCSDCIIDRSFTVVTKDCPGCKVSIAKISGCNHIECTSCSTHWCWQCGVSCDSSGAVYQHMHDVHGKIFDDETEDYIDDNEEL